MYMFAETRKHVYDINMFMMRNVDTWYKHVYTRYIHGIYMFQLTYTYSEIYVHVYMQYRHVFTMFSHFHACSSLSVQVTYLTYTSTVTDILSNVYTALNYGRTYR